MLFVGIVEQDQSVMDLLSTQADSTEEYQDI